MKTRPKTCCCIVAQSCPTLCDPMVCRMPGLRLLHCLLTHVDGSRWCHLIILSSVAPFSSCPQSFPTLESFPVNQLFTSGGQSLRGSTWASVLPMNMQNFFPLELNGWISLQSKGLSRVFSNTTLQKHQFFGTQPSSQSNIHIHTYMTTGKTIALTRRTFVGKVISLLLNTLSRLVITFLPRSKRLLTSWLQSPSAVILKPR